MDRPYLFPDTVRENAGAPAGEEPPEFEWMKAFVNAIRTARFVTGRLFEDGRWWVQLTLDLSDKKVWKVLQELAYLCNNHGVFGKLPLKLLPWSTSPENGKPEDILAWRIECYDGRFSPDDFVASVGSKIARSVATWPSRSAKPV